MRSKPELKEKCISLRLEKRMSLGAIQKETGASRGSLSAWLKPHPLTEAEKQERWKQAIRQKTPWRKNRGKISWAYQMAHKPLTSMQKAKISETAVLFRVSLLGLDVFSSPFEGDKTDWLVYSTNQKKYTIVQVKWARSASYGLPYVNLRCANGRHDLRRYQEGEVDFVIGYDLYTDTCYIWSWSEVKNKSAITIHPDAAERWDKITGG